MGSFVNALVWRIYKQSKLKTKKSKIKYSVSKGRSICTHCEHRLAVKDLLPVISWLSLKGKCRYCKRPISAQYPLVEGLTAVLFVLSYAFWPNPLIGSEIAIFSLWLAILVSFVALIIYDLRYMLLPDKIVIVTALLAFSGFLIKLINSTEPNIVINTGLALLIGGGIFYFLFQISNGRWIGGGDVKLGFVLGLIVGKPQLAVLFIFLGSLLGCIYILPLLITKKVTPKSRIPFGPFLISATIITVLWGTNIVNWYSSAILGL